MSQQDDSENIEAEVPTSKKFEDIVSSTIEQFEVLDVLDPETSMLIQSAQQMLPNVVYQIVIPELEPLVSASAKKRGRPRKSQNKPKPTILPEPTAEPPKVMSKTRSGREVKFPKHIQKDFESIEIESELSNVQSDADLPHTEKENEVVAPVHIELTQKKRKIAAQYRCPKCQKAYLGKNKMLKHLQKYPSHGPVTQKQQNHFEVWNYLVSVTQKCPSSERGTKFCQELSNLLHNLLLLTDALFKKPGGACNEVEIDKVLGNAIGLSPGSYHFNDNNLFKDVTVLQLMENTDFLGSLNKSKQDDCHCGNNKSNVATKTLKENDSQISEEIKFAQPTIIDYEMKNAKNNEEFDFSLNNYVEPPPEPKSPSNSDGTYLQAKDSNVLIDEALIHPVDELMLPVSSPGHHILDNSSSSDEVLNVDQFVNERFRKITESDLEGTMSELPPLELFEFHTR